MKKMFFRIVTLTITFALSSCKTVQVFPSENYDQIIQNVQVFDGKTITKNVTVCLKNGLISAIHDRPTNFKGENVLEANGFTLTPAFINAHVHAWDKAHTEEAAKAGVLTLLDQLNNQPHSVELLKELGTSTEAHANFHTAGYAVTVPDGHGTQFGPAPTVSSLAEVLPFIQKRVEEGSDWIKIILEKGHLNQEFPTLSYEMVQAAIDGAKQYGKLAVAHVTNLNDAVQATKMGINGLVHFWGRDSVEVSPEDIALFKEKEIFIVPTVLLMEKAKAFIPEIDMELIKRGIIKLYKAGIPLLAGTDSPNLDLDYGSSLYEEMILMHEFGVSEIDVLKSATSNIAEAFQLKNTGYIKVNAPANLVLLEGNPMTDFQSIKKVSKVWKQGRLIVE